MSYDTEQWQADFTDAKAYISRAKETLNNYSFDSIMELVESAGDEILNLRDHLQKADAHIDEMEDRIETISSEVNR